MTEDLKGLIEKIQEEGISAAEAKAHAIETEAKKRASDIIEDARKKSEGYDIFAKKEVERSRESAEATHRSRQAVIYSPRAGDKFHTR